MELRAAERRFVKAIQLPTKAHVTGDLVADVQLTHGRAAGRQI
ncbi:MAG TPA: hypothetical protein VME47_02655 [Acetobacteraceae bacterium]|nr:hypothetical protein [Acetobacteraceae bacterium]